MLYTAESRSHVHVAPKRKPTKEKHTQTERLKQKMIGNFLNKSVTSCDQGVAPIGYFVISMPLVSGQLVKNRKNPGHTTSYSS